MPARDSISATRSRASSTGVEPRYKAVSTYWRVSASCASSPTAPEYLTASSRSSIAAVESPAQKLTFPRKQRARPSPASSPSSSKTWTAAASSRRTSSRPTPVCAGLWKRRSVSETAASAATNRMPAARPRSTASVNTPSARSISPPSLSARPREGSRLKRRGSSGGSSDEARSSRSAAASGSPRAFARSPDAASRSAARRASNRERSPAGPSATTER